MLEAVEGQLNFITSMEIFESVGQIHWCAWIVYLFSRNQKKPFNFSHSFHTFKPFPALPVL